MAFTKTISDCNAYYQPDNHVKANKWRAFDDVLRNAAFVQAQRDIKVYLNRTLDDPLSADIYRDDYAVYEQALYMLENGNIQKTAGASKAVKIGRNEEHREDDNWLSPQALRYMQMSMVKIARG
jgi:hypothetical protein